MIPFVCLCCLALAIGVLGLPRPSHAANSTATDLTVAVDHAINTALQKKRVVGGVVLVALNGNILYSRAAGYADREAKTPVELNTLFRLASSSKLFTSLAAAVLLENKVIALDDPIRKWLPYFSPQAPDGTTPVITVRHLLTHTAGLAYGFFDNAHSAYTQAGISDGLDASSISLEENIRRLASVPLLYKPGTAWLYSLATDVLGALLAKAGGGTLPEVMEKLIFKPLQLLDTGFVVTDKKRLAVAYRDAQPEPAKMAEPERFALPNFLAEFSPARICNPQAFPSGGAGMVATASDVLRALELIRKQGAPLLSSTIMASMNSNQIGNMLVEPGWGFGLGWGVLLDPKQVRTPQSVGTLSWSGVYGSTWFVDPAKELSVVILTNTTFEGMSGRLVNHIRDAIYANLPKVYS